MKNKYINPSISIIEVTNNSFICNSNNSNSDDRRCDSFCRLWHTCRDRCAGTICIDKRT